jgi:serine/threonine protein kinase
MESPPAAPTSSSPGSQFGKFSLVARLATGGMAEIFLARLVGAAGFEKLVCVKRILPHLARDRQFVAMFLDEARIAARISHPNVCQVYELGEIDGSYYIAMEYLEGVPLACFRRHDYYGPEPDPRLVAGIAIQACEGLHHAHKLKRSDGSTLEVVHRDVSPQNLFVTADGIVKVLDFGIAKIQDATVRTSTGAIKGTYAYMAPEQLRGEKVDRRTDVFALGIVMWETLTRRYLFKRETEFLTFQAITTEPIPDVCAIRPDVPASLSSVIMTALARNRDERFPSARMLGEAVATAVAPLSGAAISEEIQRAFPGQLAEQAELIRVARNGGSFDLEIERGPSVGHGADLATTPVSKQHGLDALPLTISSVGPLAASASKTIVSSPQLPAMPSRRRPWRPVLIAVLALAVGGAAAVVYSGMQTHREPTAASREPTTEGREPTTASREPTTASREPTAATREPTTASREPTTASREPTTEGREPTTESREPSAAGGSPTTEGRSPTTEGREPTAESRAPTAAAATPPPNAATPAAVKPPERHASPPRPSPAAAAKPSGPPGFITIDSSPVYAVIYIDGKSYGETPLVRLELSPGRHVVHAVAPSGATRDVRIVIDSGKVAAASRIVW